MLKTASLRDWHMVGDTSGSGLCYYLRARMLVIVLGAKVGHDALLPIGAFVFGQATR